MCGRFALGLDEEELEEGVQQLDLPARRWLGRDQYRAGNYNVAPQNRSPVVRRAAPADENNDEVVLETMKWGLIPHWTKRAPDYASALKTINARDDTVMAGSGMWHSIKGRKRCIVVCQGFYEWLKKGKDKVPHFTKRKDGKLMCFAGLWDSVTYEGETEELHTFTIITTSSNKQLSFLHDRMPVILPTKSAMETWLDTSSQSWSSDLASLLVPFPAELECYPVPKEVGKVGNNSADFVRPVSERKGNIAGFFANQAKKSASPAKPPAKGEAGGNKEEKAEDEEAKKGAKVVGEEDDEVMEVNPDEVADKGVKRSQAGQGEHSPSKRARTEPSPSKKKQASPGKSPGKKEAGQTSLTDFVK